MEAIAEFERRFGRERHRPRNEGLHLVIDGLLLFSDEVGDRPKNAVTRLADIAEHILAAAKSFANAHGIELRLAAPISRGALVKAIQRAIDRRRRSETKQLASEGDMSLDKDASV
jgi:hypothetical protein